MIVSGSEIAALNECERKYYYQYVLGLYPRDESLAIETGNFGHDYMEMFFMAIMEGATKEEALNKMEPADRSSHSLKALYLATKFCMDFNVNSGRPRIVEEKFRFELLPEVKIGMKPDLVWEFKSGVQKLYDWKFTGRSWSDKAATQHYQLPSYAGYLNKNCGYNIKSLNYVFFNTRDNVDNIAKYKIFNIIMHQPEMDSVIRDQALAVDRIHDLRESPIHWVKENARRVNNKNVCDYCYFQYPCRVERQGKDATGALAMMYQENTYGYED